MTRESLALKQIQSTICLIRGQRVILDRELARLYGVPTKALKQAVRRNALRFPSDFMFELNAKEFAAWRSQIVTSTADRKGLRYAPMAFTEQGVAMLSSVLKSERAIRVNISIVRAFVELRTLLATHAELAHKLEELEMRYDAQFRSVFEAIRQLMTPPARPRKQIGFRVREKPAVYRTQRQPMKPHA